MGIFPYFYIAQWKQTKANERQAWLTNLHAFMRQIRLTSPAGLGRAGDGPI